MAESSKEGHCFLDSQRSRKLFEALSFRPIARNRKVCYTTSQKGSGCAQSEITSLVGNKAPDEDKFKFSVAPGRTQSVRAQGRADTVLRNKEELVAIVRKLRICLRRAGYDSRRSTKGGLGKRKIAVKASEFVEPTLLVICLTETPGPRQTTIDRPNDKRN